MKRAPHALISLGQLSVGQISSQLLKMRLGRHFHSICKVDRFKVTLRERLRYYLIADTFNIIMKLKKKKIKIPKINS